MNTRLIEDLRECSERIGNMCAECRGPRMSVPVRQDDDDIFISNTVIAAALEIERLHGVEADARRYQWLRDHACNSLHLTRNGDHACNYMSAAAYIESAASDWFKDEDPDEIGRMKSTNTIWCLQVYPDTPVGFVAWNGSTLDYVVDAAIAASRSTGAADVGEDRG